jgi:peroxin-10
MSDHLSDKPIPSQTASASFNYPFAAAPDIVRSHQKDAYFEGVLMNHISNILRQLCGARFIHKWTAEASAFSDLLYLSLTTLIGNRTLGEEYCDIVQIEDDTLKLPSITRRAGYILTAILLPYSLNRLLPSFRARIRAKLEHNLRRLIKHRRQSSYSFRIQSYLLKHLATITSPSPVHAATLTIFYFTGSYYQLSKRLWGLRYIFTKKIGPSEARIGYEVLGVLLVLQMTVQSWIHLHSTLIAGRSRPAHFAPTLVGSAAVLENGVEVSVDDNAYTTNNELLLEAATGARTAINIEKATHTPVLGGPWIQLKGDDVMAWIKGSQQRRCTLCLEELKDPSATQCGHVFCWACIGDWVREKPECPLCRRGCLAQHILPLRS